MSVNLNSDIKSATIRYHFFVDLLEKINNDTDSALKNEQRWFVFGPKVCSKFLSQAKTLMVLLSDKVLKYPNGLIKEYEDISTTFTALRMQFETHALFYHLFMPSGNWSENVLRFRLWEMDGIKHKIAISTVALPQYQQYLKIVKDAILDLDYFKQLDTRIQSHLLKNTQWRFSTESLNKNYTSPISYKQLIKNTKIKESFSGDLYKHFSAFTHPTYAGVKDNYDLEDENWLFLKLGTISYASMVTCFFIEDMAKRYSQGKEVLNSLSANDLEVYQSLIRVGRYD